VGAGYTKAKISYSQSNSGGMGSSYTNYTYEFYTISAAYGLDAHLTPHFLRPFGLYAGVEGQIIQSVLRGGRINENTMNYFNPSEPAEPKRMTDINVSAFFGAQYDF
jgi:hypothetical protein